MDGINLLRAAEAELGLALGREHAPVFLVGILAIVASAVWLPGFVKRLEVEGVDAPGEYATDTLVVEQFRVLIASLGLFVVGAII